MSSNNRSPEQSLPVRLYRKFMDSQSMKYLFSSCAAFAIDYVLLLILDALLPVASLEIGAVIAWVCSSLTNFFMNRNFVFRSNTPIGAAFIEYYGLAAVVFVLKTYVLIELLTRVLHIPLIIAKPIAEVVFFVFNYIIQKLFIFRKKQK
ncbi:MAG: GtrA family protein [Clostridia bacterium]|nr:GtrA family protein [Clostridia bacterium]